MEQRSFAKAMTVTGQRCICFVRSRALHPMRHTASSMRGNSRIGFASRYRPPGKQDCGSGLGLVPSEWVDASSHAKLLRMEDQLPSGSYARYVCIVRFAELFL